MGSGAGPDEMDMTMHEEQAKSASERVRRQKRRKRRRKAVMGLIPRYLLLAAAAVLTIAVVYGFATKIARPYELQHQEARQISGLKSQLGTLDASNADLQNRIAYLKRPDGIENAARGLDYTKPGEVRLQVTVEPPATGDDASSRGFAGMVRRAWKSLISKS
jgi:cell division protein FtsB